MCCSEYSEDLGAVRGCEELNLQVGGVEWGGVAVGAGWMIDEVERGRKRKCVKLKKSQELAKGQNVQRDELESGKNSVRTKVNKGHREHESP